MRAVICEIEMFIPAANSLKAKRQVIKSIIGRIKSRCNASVIESSYQDLWQRAGILVAIVGTTQAVLDQQLNSVRRIVDDSEGVEVASFDVEYI